MSNHVSQGDRGKHLEPWATSSAYTVYQLILAHEMVTGLFIITYKPKHTAHWKPIEHYIGQGYRVLDTFGKPLQKFCGSPEYW